jgi:hypothetical protein
MGTAIAVAERGVVSEPVLHLPHPALRLQRADRRGHPGTREVVDRGERRAIGKSRCRGDDIGLTTEASVSNGDHATRFATQLALDGRTIGLGHRC